MTSKFFYGIAVIAVVAISCKKDNNNNTTAPNAVTGTWKFISVQANTQSTVTSSNGTDSARTETLSNYTSTNNTGTVTFTSDSILTSGVSYSVSSVAVAYEYEDGVLLDSISSPFNVTIPSTSSAGTYKLVGSDSITFVGLNITGGGIQQGTTNGSKIQISGTTMTLTTIGVKDSTADDSGITEYIKDRATLITTLQKQ